MGEKLGSLGHLRHGRLPLIGPGLRHAYRQLAHALDHAHALGHADGAARIERVEKVASTSAPGHRPATAGNGRLSAALGS